MSHAALIEEVRWAREAINRLREKAGFLPMEDDLDADLMTLLQRQRWAIEEAEPFLTAAEPVPEE